LICECSKNVIEVFHYQKTGENQRNYQRKYSVGNNYRWTKFRLKIYWYIPTEYFYRYIPTVSATAYFFRWFYRRNDRGIQTEIAVQWHSTVTDGMILSVKLFNGVVFWGWNNLKIMFFFNNRGSTLIFLPPLWCPESGFVDNMLSTIKNKIIKPSPRVRAFPCNGPDALSHRPALLAYFLALFCFVFVF
jgi:hypothetical protein